MMREKGPIYLITGVPGVGKSSVGRALMERFEFGFYLSVDDLREWVVSGIAHPVPEWNEETSRQFKIARKAAVEMARIYASEGFAVVIDDVILLGEWEDLFVTGLEEFEVRKVFLWTDLGVNQARNRDRTGKKFDTAMLVGLIDGLHGWMMPEEYEEAGWLVIDSTKMGVEETVNLIIGIW